MTEETNLNEHNELNVQDENTGTPQIVPTEAEMKALMEEKVETLDLTEEDHEFEAVETEEDAPNYAQLGKAELLDAAIASVKEKDATAEPNTRTLTASLHVDYFKPTPLGIELEVRGKVKELKERKVVIEEWILANGVITVRGEVVAVQVPESMVEELVKQGKESQT